MIQTTTETVDTFQVLDPIIVPPVGTNPLAYVESGLTNLTVGQQSKSVTFQTAKVSAYVFVEAEIVNTVDSPPLILDFEITNQALTGFTIQLSGLPDTANSFFKWRVGVPPS